MRKNNLQSGAIEYLKNADEKDDDSKIKTLKEGCKNAKKGSDLTNADVANLVFAIAKHLKII